MATPMKFKGESVVAAILPSRTVTSFFIIAKPSNYVKCELHFPHGLKSRTHM